PVDLVLRDLLRVLRLDGSVFVAFDGGRVLLVARGEGHGRRKNGERGKQPARCSVHDPLPPVSVLVRPARGARAAFTGTGRKAGETGSHGRACLLFTRPSGALPASPPANPECESGKRRWSRAM